MNPILQQMLDRYSDDQLMNKKNVLKEILQEIVLCGLSRAGFFKNVAFYGGTALRIFYGLDRFSEDLDFSLKNPMSEFEFSSYFPFVERELLAYGLEVEVKEKTKTVDSQIKSAFLKGDSKEFLISFFGDLETFHVPQGELLKIKLEVDTNPPAFASFEHKFRLLPSPYEVLLYDPPSLFAGKLHAVLCRAWKDRVKGRDLYDYIFYLARKTPINLEHLRARLIQTHFIAEEAPFSFQDLLKELRKRFSQIDYKQAAVDVTSFIKDPSSVRLWSETFFQQITSDYFTEMKI